MPSLRDLRLGKNQLESVPASLWHLTTLETLDLSDRIKSRLIAALLVITPTEARTVFAQAASPPAISKKEGLAGGPMADDEREALESSIVIFERYMVEAPGTEERGLRK